MEVVRAYAVCPKIYFMFFSCVLTYPDCVLGRTERNGDWRPKYLIHDLMNSGYQQYEHLLAQEQGAVRYPMSWLVEAVRPFSTLRENWFENGKPVTTNGQSSESRSESTLPILSPCALSLCKPSLLDKCWIDAEAGWLSSKEEMSWWFK